MDWQSNNGHKTRKLPVAKTIDRIAKFNQTSSPVVIHRPMPSHNAQIVGSIELDIQHYCIKSSQQRTTITSASSVSHPQAARPSSHFFVFLTESLRALLPPAAHLKNGLGADFLRDDDPPEPPPPPPPTTTTAGGGGGGGGSMPPPKAPGGGGGGGGMPPPGGPGGGRGIGGT